MSIDLVQRKNKSPVFSILMSVFNHTECLKNAIASVQNQSFDQWELIILDNGNQNEDAWNIIKNASESDDRIIGLQSKTNVGWPKGASLCLKQAEGKYMTFLAADDFLDPDALQCVWEEVEKNYPDVIWVGYATVHKNNNHLMLGDCNIPQYTVFNQENKPQQVEAILNTVYYNAFFHYLNIDFLRRENIDFFEPYCADCGGMTQALCTASKMTVLNKAAYFLTIETSHTRGSYSWDSYIHTFISQWNSIMALYVRERYYNKESINYIAKRIENNHISQLKNMCLGHVCRDKYMHNMDITACERLKQLEDILSNETMIRIMRCYGREEYTEQMSMLFQCFLETYLTNNSFEVLVSECRWLGYILAAVYEIKDNTYFIKRSASFESMSMLMLGLGARENRGLFGFEFLLSYVDLLGDQEKFGEWVTPIQVVLAQFSDLEKRYMLDLYYDFIGEEASTEEIDDKLLEDLRVIYSNIARYYPNDPEINSIKVIL